MSKRINLEAFPEGTFDHPYFGMDLTRDKVQTITQGWTEKHYAAAEEAGLGRYILTDDKKAVADKVEKSDKLEK